MQGNSASAAAGDCSHSDEVSLCGFLFLSEEPVAWCGNVGNIMGNHYSSPILHGDNSTHLFLYLQGNC